MFEKLCHVLVLALIPLILDRLREDGTAPKGDMQIRETFHVFLESRRQWNNIFKLLKKKKPKVCQPF